MKNGKVIFYVSFFIVLIVGFWIYSTSVIKQANSVDKKVISIVNNFNFVNQYNDSVSLRDLDNKVVVVNFFFTSCKGICPQMNANLKTIYDEFTENPNFLILSHTVEPEKDSVPVLKKYAQQYNLKNKRWLFLTGNKMDLYNQARYSYLLDDPQNNVGNIADQFIHTQFFALVNTKKQVIGIYDSFLSGDIQKLKKDIKALLN